MGAGESQDTRLAVTRRRGSKVVDGWAMTGKPGPRARLPGTLY